MEVKVQHRQAQKKKKMHSKKKNCDKFFYIVGFCILVAFASLCGIMLYSGVETAFIHAINMSKRLAQLEA